MIFKCENINEHIIQAAYRESSIFRYLQVKWHVQKCKKCYNIYKEHLKLARELSNVNSLECPENLLKEVEKKIGQMDIVQPTFFSDLGTIFSGFSIRNFSAALVLMVVLSVGVIYLRQPRPVDIVQQKYSQAEINKASVQAKESLALIGEILNSTTSTLEKDVSKHVSRPLRKSIKLVNELFEQEKLK